MSRGSQRPRITDAEAVALRRLAGQLAIVILERRKRAYAAAGVDPRIRERAEAPEDLKPGLSPAALP